MRSTTYSGQNLFTHMATTEKKISVKAQLQAAQERSVLFSRPGFLIRRLHQLHSALFLEETREFNVTPVQYSLMTTLAELGEMTQNALTLEIGLERTSVAEVILRLQTRELLERKQSPEDARVKLINLTRKGKSLVAKMRPAVQRAHDRTICQLPKDEQEQFLLQMIRLVEANNDIMGVPFRLP
jgi:DNA-binding MarR family transcriptional regulator